MSFDLPNDAKHLIQSFLDRRLQHHIKGYYWQHFAAFGWCPAFVYLHVFESKRRSLPLKTLCFYQSIRQVEPGIIIAYINNTCCHCPTFYHLANYE